MSQLQIMNAGNMVGVLNSQVLDVEQISLGSIQAVFTGSPVGTLQLYVSDDIIAPSADPNAAVTNWDAYGNSYSVSAAGHYTFNISNMGYKWCKLQYTPTSGSGALSMNAEIKNVP